MTETNTAERHATLSLSREELMVINNALNAVCHAVRVTETDFPFLIGVTREEGRALLRRVSHALDVISQEPQAPR